MIVAQSGNIVAVVQPMPKDATVTQTDRFHAGLVFLPSQLPDLDGFCRIVAGTLADYGHIVERQSMASTDEARITTRSYAVRLSLAPARGGQVALAAPRARPTSRLEPRLEPQSARLELTLVPADPRGTDINQSQLILLVMLYRMIEAHGARHVEWLDPSIVLPAGRFLSAFSRVSPRRVRGRQEILDAAAPRTDGTGASGIIVCNQNGDDMSFEETSNTEAPEHMSPELELSLAFRSDQQEAEAGDEAENDIRRLAAWGMTGVVAMMSGPVGLSMAAVNLLRGEDFRLNTQVLALTGFFGFVTTGSAVADVLALLPL